MEYTLNIEMKPTSQDIETIHKGLDAFNEEIVGPDKRKELTFFARNCKGNVIGGIQGNCGSYGWLWIGTLWVSETARGEGLGSQLLSAIETEATKLGCKYAYLNSFSFGPVDFYKKSGYEIYAELNDFPHKHSVFSLRKKLTS